MKLYDETDCLPHVKPALLPCPFCGGEAQAVIKEDYSGGVFASAECTECVAAISIPFSNMADGKEETRQVIAAWNRRAPLADAVLREAGD